MADAERAIPLHEVGATPTKKNSVPVTLLRAPGTVRVPTPPSGAGTFTLQSTAGGTLSWVAVT